MEANDSVWENNRELVDLLTPKGKSRTLREVVDRILKVYPHESPIQVFKHLSEDEPWFEGCFLISARFDPRLMGELLIRPLTVYEKPAHSPKIKFYLEDGNHRALVYAVFLRLHAEQYQPVRVIFSKDWTHLIKKLIFMKPHLLGEGQVFLNFTIDGFPDNLCLYFDTGPSLTEYDIWSLQYAVGKIYEFGTL